MIHKTALVDKNAKSSDKVKIGPYSIIGPNVEIGSNTVLHSHVNIVGYTKIGNNNEIYPYSSIGTPPQDLKYKGEKNSLIIGDNNKFREFVNINPGTEQGGGITSIGDNNLFMVYCHVAHDCKISSNIVLANNVQVGGHVKIEKNAIVGGSCAIHQFSRIGEASMVGGMTGVLSDVIPYGLSLGNRNIKKIQLAYDLIFKSLKFRENIETLDEELKNNEFVKKILHFINSDKKRPISLPPDIK